MLNDLSAALATSAPPPRLFEAPLEGFAWLLGLLALATFFATLRLALLRSHPSRVLARAPSERARRRTEGYLARVDRLAASASILKSASELAFVTVLLGQLARGEELGAGSVILTLVLAVPLLHLFGDGVATAFQRRWGDGLLHHALPWFHPLQLPLGMLVAALDGLRHAVFRVLGLEVASENQRRIVEGLRDVVHDASISEDLGEAEREMIGNVMEFRDVDVAAVMTPRTEVFGVDVSEGLLGAAKRLAECAHSRIPVYEGSLDTIIGTISARDLVQQISAGDLGEGDLRAALHPTYFVPETKRVSELLAEFRQQKTKMAVVLDEYGGTAGLVSQGDIIAEIVGDLHDEYDEEAPPPVRRRADGTAEVDAALHVSEVNEELDLEIPEAEDFETLGGYVLSELGHFPKAGERFVQEGVEYTVVEANERRVLTVRIRRPAHEVA